MAKLTLKAYYPWRFRLYVVAVHTFAFLAGLEADEEVLQRHARAAKRYREIIPTDEAQS
jgi:hypothetical protein